ncbi:MAG: ABC transporter substrate-binding protein [Atribacterota bacterium]|nr:ABC transporter substrate-binding protein [Atribacterota bacterium]
MNWQKNIFLNSIRVFLTILVALLLSVSAVAYQENQKVWKIDFLNTLTGSVASIGNYMSWSAQRAAREINESGGINGKPVIVLEYDTGDSAEKAISEMAKIIDHSMVVLGPVPEVCIQASMPMAVKQGLFCMTASTSYEIAINYFPWSLSWFPPTEDVLPGVTKTWVELHDESIKSIVQFTEKQAVWPQMAKFHTIGLETAGVNKILEVEVPRDAIMFDSLVVKALSNQPDGFILTCSPEKAAKIVVSLQRQGWSDTSKILIFSSADDTPLYTTAGEYLNGCYIYNYIDPNSQNERWISFREDYKREHGGLEPSSLSTIYYDCIYMIKEAIENTGITGNIEYLTEERIKIRDYCRNVKAFQGIQQTWDMNDGVPSEKGAFLFIIQDNQKDFVCQTE